MKPLMLSAVLVTVTSLSVCGQSTSSNKASVAPQVINSTGGSWQKGPYSIDWSVGEMSLVNQLTGPGTSLIVTNGFLQPYTFDLSTPDPEHLFTYDEIKIFPNPTWGPVEVNFATKQQGKVKLQVHDRMGNLIIHREFQLYGFGRSERINLTSVPNGTYLLRVELLPDPGSVPKKGAYKIFKVGR